jgi:CubicO group peptidase (beta-lactamase class C family)
MSYAEYLQKYFALLQMDRTAVWSEQIKIKNEASGYEFDKPTNNFKESGPNENIFFSTEGDGGIYTCIDDYLKWFGGLQSAGICSEALIRQARSPQFPVDKNNHLSYGFGWFVDEGLSPDRVFHSGSNGGFRAYSYKINSKKILIVIFSNRDDVDFKNW